MNQNLIVLFLIFASGAILVGAGIFNWTILTGSNASDFLKSKWGPHAGRIVVVALGILVLLMGYYSLSTGKFARPI